MFSIDGIVSGFETSSIIESLLGFQQKQIDSFNARKNDIATEQGAFNGIEAQLLTLKSSLAKLNRNKASVFDVRAAKSSHEEILSVTADNGAHSGTYQLTVNSLAKSHQISSQGFDTSSDEIATGEISFKVGNRSEQTITVGPGNNTLVGLVSTINEQVEDVNASIVFDQGSNSYRMLLSSRHTGSQNEITITNNLTGGTGTVPDFSGPAVQEAADAMITLGSGPGAITTQYASNQVDGLIQDVTIDLLSAAPGTSVTIDVSSDTSAAEEAIQGFVEDFNSVIDFIESQTKFDAATNRASPLLGNRSVSSIKNRLLSIVSDTIGGSAGLSRLGQIGIDLNTKGRLVLNSSQLSDALNGQAEGVDAAKIRNLFGLNATSTNAGIEFLTGGTRTKESKVPYQVDITQAAERASITAGSDLANHVTIDDTNHSFRLTIDGIVSETLSLANGSYTPEELAAHLESTINNSETLGVHNVLVGLTESNALTITTEAYGIKAQVSSLTGNAISTLGFSGLESDSGQDVAGVFVVDGIEETAKGSGRVLIGNPDNENTGDLQLRVTLTSQQLIDGADGEINVTRGVSARLDEYLGQIMNAETGLLKTINEDFTSRIESIDRSITRVEAITESKRQYLIAEFTALESILSELQTTGSFISTQLSSLNTFRSNSNR